VAAPLGRPNARRCGESVTNDHTEPTSGERNGEALPVLVAEDNAINRTVAVKMLERAGVRTAVAQDGQEAVEMVARERYSAVLMDCQMPRLDGYGATAEIRRLEGSTRHTPIIAMTAHAMEGDRERCMQAGMDDYLAKPVTPPNIRSMVDRWVTNGREAANRA
jgi:CheY-like chemotaxis protein